MSEKIKPAAGKPPKPAGWKACSTLLLLLAVTPGCMVNVYHRPNGPTSLTAGLLMNDTMRKLTIDRVAAKTSTGLAADGVNLEVDNEGLKFMIEAAVKAALSSAGIPVP